MKAFQSSMPSMQLEDSGPEETQHVHPLNVEITNTSISMLNNNDTLIGETVLESIECKAPESSQPIVEHPGISKDDNV